MPALRKTAKITGRRDEATKMYLEGNSLRAVADKLGCSHETIRTDVIESLKTYGNESREMLVAQKREQYAALLQAHWEAAKTGDIAAGAIVLKILESERKLFGIDAPGHADSIACNQAVINILPQYAALVAPLVESQQRTTGD
ncbi:MAG: helix-turn-helix domain-containing protein [Thermoguttaceae bacterium]